MKCPRCKTPLSSRTRESVSIDCCAACNGTWVRPEQIKSMIKNHETKFSQALVQATLKQTGPQIPPAEQETILACPTCAKPMNTVNYNYSSGIIVNVCRDQHGMWLDQNELERVEIFMEHWDQEKAAHKSTYLQAMRTADQDEKSRIQAIDDDIQKTISPNGLLSVLSRIFRE